jgi:hypothetical protein
LDGAIRGFCLINLIRNELCYVLGLANMYRPNFPANIPGFQDNEGKLYGEYWMRRLVLEAWERENTK